MSDAPPAQLSPEQVRFVANAPFAFVLSGGVDAAPDVSPRGDGPGFVRIVSPGRLQLPDRLGNNRVDTIRNVLADPRVALVFMQPGSDMMLEVSGIATIRTDPDLLPAFEHRGKLPRSVMDIVVTAADLRQSSAFADGAFWAPLPDREAAGLSSLGHILADQVGGMTGEEADAFVMNSYKNRLY